MSRQRDIQKILVSEYVTIGELVRITGTRYSTLKFYTEENMLHFEQAEEGLTRRYVREEALIQLDKIKEMRAQGLTIMQIKELL